MNVIVNTGCANINSLKFAVERLGEPVIVTAEQELIQKAERVLLPGVGSAQFAMHALKERRLTDTLQNLNQPVLGICLGMQILFERSTEGETSCLGVIPGHVEHLQVGALRLPHMGWNTLSPVSDHPLLKGVTPKDYFYFVHSYGAGISEYTLAGSEYGQTFSAAIGYENYLGVQFHPERSGPLGAKILQNFLEIES